jgi:DNA-binding IclR family transcriptional regulator
MSEERRAPSLAAKTGSVPSLERGMAIMESVARSKIGLTLSQVARSLHLPKSSAHSLLLTLQRLGYLYRNEATHRYRCDLKLVRIANLVLGGYALRGNAKPIISRLMEDTKFTVHMAVRSDTEVVLAEKSAPYESPHLATWVGKRLDFHCTSLGKCLLAFLPGSEIDRIVRERGLLRHNENTIASVSRLKAELAKVRNQGFAVDDEEEELGVRCVGAPVFDSEGEVVAAISISGNTEQINRVNLPQLCLRVCEAAEALSHEMRRMSVSPSNVRACP